MLTDLSQSKFYVLLPERLIPRCQEIGGAIWVFGWCVARTTIEWRLGYGEDEMRVGAVLRGKPIDDVEIAAALRVSKKTASRWRKAACEAGLICSVRAPYGHRLLVPDSNRFPDKRDAGEVPEWAEKVILKHLAKQPSAYSSDKTVQETGHNCPGDRTDSSDVIKNLQESKKRETTHTETKRESLVTEKQKLEATLPNVATRVEAPRAPFGTPPQGACVNRFAEKQKTADMETLWGRPKEPGEGLVAIGLPKGFRPPLAGVWDSIYRRQPSCATIDVVIEEMKSWLTSMKMGTPAWLANPHKAEIMEGR